MTVKIRKYRDSDVRDAIRIWNDVVEDGAAFPQSECLDEESGSRFFKSQSHTGLAFEEKTGEMAGLYILHPNNVGRCGHICNASFAVKKEWRGHHIGEEMVLDCEGRARECGFRILQLNAVVKTNEAALHLYRKLGFIRLGVIPGGFRLKDGSYEDIIPHYYVL